MSEQRVEKDKVVTLTYMIRDESGLCEKSDYPVSYLHGAPDSPMFPKIEKALEGRKVGDEVEVTLSPEEGFGQPDPAKTFSDRIANVPPQYRQVGAQAVFHNDLGESLTMTVVRIEDGMIHLDGNHPLAGKTLTFTVKIVDIRDATRTEMAQGQVAEDRSLLPH